MKDAISRRKASRALRQADQALAFLARAATSAQQSRWHQLVAFIPPTMFQLLEVKWRLPAGWEDGDLPRPCSPEEMADVTGMTIGGVRALDWISVDFFRDVRRRNRLLSPFLTVPIDAAQGWWIERFAWNLNPDGSRKPRDTWGTPPGQYPPEADDRHEIENADDLKRHLLEVHELAVADMQSLSGLDHRLAHDDEAQDRKWDQLRE